MLPIVDDNKPWRVLEHWSANTEQCRVTENNVKLNVKQSGPGEFVS